VALFQNPFKAKPPTEAPLKPPQVPPVPASLPKITAPTAADICKTSKPSPAAQALLKPQQTPPQYLSTLQDHHMGTDMVNTMAHGMSDHDGVNWAAQSAGKVSDKLPPHEVTAMKAAQEWVKNPTPTNQAAAGAAAGKTEYRGPGSWAAQGAAWAQPAKPAGASGAAAPRLTPHAVSGAVLSAAAIKANPSLAAPTAKVPAAQAPQLQAPAVNAPKAQQPQIPAAPTAPTAPATVPPSVQAHTFKQQHPFISMGLDIASGKHG
jgi:hypothetical protein